MTLRALDSTSEVTLELVMLDLVDPAIVPSICLNLSTVARFDLSKIILKMLS